jgi:Ran GTPase-activating protein (RanGAP) involved in mRNA processing and transport/GTPase SAR1 family protein
MFCPVSLRPPMKRKAAADDPANCTRCVDLSGRDLTAVISHNNIADFFQEQLSQFNGAADSLDVSKCRLGPSGTSLLLEFISDQSSPLARLKHLIIQRNAIGSVGGRAIGRFLSQNGSLELLDLSLNDIKAGGGEPTVANAISDALIKNTTLKALILDKCAVGPEGGKELANALAFNESLTRLELAGNMIGPFGGSHIFNALMQNSTLRELGLKMNRIGGSSDKFDVQTLSESLSGGICRLTKLDLSYNDLRCEGCTILAQALVSKSCTLIELILEKNDIEEDGSVALARSLCVNSSLQVLDFKGNKVGNGGAKAFGSALTSNNTLKSIDLSSCSVGNNGGAAIGVGLGQNYSLEHLVLDKNQLGDGADCSLFSMGLAINTVLKRIHLKGNGFAADEHNTWDRVISAALSNNSSLRHVDLSNNALSDPSIIDAIATADCSIEYFDISDNNFEFISIEAQLLLSGRISSSLHIDMSLNPLSSPPLGRLATFPNLQNYLTLLASEKTEVTRIRLMVLGYGGVGKSTFCRAHTADLGSQCGRNDFQNSLLPVKEWNTERLVDWAEQLGTVWSKDAAKLVADQNVSGKELIAYVDTTNASDVAPSKALLEICSSRYPRIDCNTFSRAIFALNEKGYMSTVGAVKVDGTIELGRRKCSMVDFAGQVEFLVSHQLLLSSMHTICMIIQTLPSFGKPEHRHFGSWDYWARFLASLGDRRRGSLLLALSQIDRVSDTEIKGSIDYASDEYNKIKERAVGAISMPKPLTLDYNNILETVTSVKAALSKSVDEVASTWFTPESYEKLSAILADVAQRKASIHELPILTTSELLDEIDSFCATSERSSLLLSQMKSDSNLLDRAIAYLEAVGDVMQAEDCLLLDPIGWFSGFLAHFIKDDLACITVQVNAASLRRQRGVVSLEEIVIALCHDYKKPREHVSQIMSVLCGLEICVALSSDGEKAYLFPCLLTSLTKLSDINASFDVNTYPASAIRGHRFREISGFIPPGMFPGLLARIYRSTEVNVMHPLRVWRDNAILLFNNKTVVLLKFNIENATLDVVGWASDNENLFVGAAKGQACVVTWIVHWIKTYLRSYTQLKFQESWLCPNPVCHGIKMNTTTAIPFRYTGSEFALCSKSRTRHASHDCNVEGCWRFLGNGHSLERMHLCPNGIDVCQACNSEPVFMLRDRVV